MHDTALEIGRLAIEIYGQKAKPRILEIGSLDVNGSLRQFAPQDSEYVGVDMVEGKGVDVVVVPDEPLPFDEESFDLAIASSVFEHDPAFWMTFLDLGRVLRDGGFLYINAPSNGKVHRYPEDHWRFYPDSGMALERWAKSQHVELTLVESFTAPQLNDRWNDFVAVFRKGAGDAELPARCLNTDFNGANIWKMGAKQPANPKDFTQDMELLDTARKAAATLEAEVLKEKERTGEFVSELQGRIATLESTLRQREEEIEQTRRDLDAARQSGQEIGLLRGKLKDADAWVFRLAGERQAAEQLASRQHRRADDAVAKLALHEADIRRLNNKISQAVDDRRKVEKQLMEARSALEEAQEKTSQARSDLQSAQSSIKSRFQELATLTKLLEKSEKNRSVVLSQQEWLLETYAVMANRPWWWALMPPRWSKRREHARLRRKALFDAKRYLELYPDVAAEGMDPVHHYIMHGMMEGRTLVR